MKEYSIKDLSLEFGVSERTILRQIQTILDKLKNPYSKDFRLSEELKNNIFSDKIQTNSDNENSEFTHIEHFTEEEYLEFQKRLTEYPLLKEQIQNSKEYLNIIENQMEYFKNAYNKQLDMHENLIHSVRNFSDNLKQRNYIEAKEKGLDQ
jgi:DeoR/GlpR family transcriptional regulator of sugar metabolism